MKLFRFILLFILVYLAGTIWAIHAYGVWGFIASILLLGLLWQIGKRLAWQWILNVPLKLMRTKGAVLRNADARVLSVTPAPAPTQVVDSPAEWDDDVTIGVAANYDWYYLDVTITPQPTTGPFTLWEPGELILVSQDADPQNLGGDDNELGYIESFQVWQEGVWMTDEIGKYEGPQRIKFYVGIRPDAKRLRFRYYFEIFGYLEIPAPRSWLNGEMEYPF